MLRLLKRFTWLGLLGGGLQASYAFSLLGPVNEAYQVNVIGYNLPGDIGAPKNLAQEYRRNTPVMYYTCDANFWDYFGTRGVLEVDKAFAAFNSIPAASQMTADLSEFPFAARRRNFKADSLFLYDLKSVVMSLVIEQLGLAEPERYIWTIHNRFLLPNTQCPQGEIYDVIKRNFDPIMGTSLDQLKPTSYLNGALYSYQLIELCNAPLPPQAWAQPVPVDAMADTFTALAAGYGFNNSLFSFSPYGAFFTGITYDDAGGLRYLLRVGNRNVESAGPATLTLVTNPVPQLITTSNLTLLAAQSITNDAGPLQALYPNVVILTTSNYFINENITNYTAYFTNFPWDPIGTAAHLQFVTNVTPAVVTRYVHTFGNLLSMVPTETGWITAPLYTLPDTNGEQWVTIQTTSVGVTNAPWMPVGTNSVVTNTSLITYITNNAVVGEYITLPTNSCEIGIIAAQLTNVVTYTNVLISATNIFTTNVIGGTNVGTVLSFSQDIIGYFTNHTFVIYAVNCETNSVALRGGVEKISFIRRDYDSLLGRFFVPLTNEYSVTEITNSVAITRKMRRTITGPDILLTARDTAPGPDQDPRRVGPPYARNITFNAANAYPNLAGPGTIEGWNGAGPGTTFIFNNVGPIYRNYGPATTNAFRTELDQVTLFQWGSFDGTTNAPVVYPNDVTIDDMEMQVLVQISPPYLPPGRLGMSYNAQLLLESSTDTWKTTSSWALAPGFANLPPGLALTMLPDRSGLISGTPVQTGTFDFVVRVVDSEGHKVDRSYAIRIDPAQ